MIQPNNGQALSTTQDARPRYTGPGSIFICYRREDSADVTGRIYDRLVDHFGPERGDKRGFDLISDVLLFGALWYSEPNAISNAIGYAKHRSRSHDAVIRVYDEAGNVIETHEHKGEFKESGEAAVSAAASV
jgi:hypothetical protein